MKQLYSKCRLKPKPAGKPAGFGFVRLVSFERRADQHPQAEQTQEGRRIDLNPYAVDEVSVLRCTEDIEHECCDEGNDGESDS